MFPLGGNWQSPLSANPAVGWAPQIYPYVKSTAVYHCPDDTNLATGGPSGPYGGNSYGSIMDVYYGPGNCHYFSGVDGNDNQTSCSNVIGLAGIAIAAVQEVATKGVIFDQYSTWHDPGNSMGYKREMGFADGHVKFVRAADYAPTPTTGINLKTQ